MFDTRAPHRHFSAQPEHLWTRHDAPPKTLRTRVGATHQGEAQGGPFQQRQRAASELRSPRSVGSAQRAASAPLSAQRRHGSACGVGTAQHAASARLTVRRRHGSARGVGTAHRAASARLTVRRRHGSARGVGTAQHAASARLRVRGNPAISTVFLVSSWSTGWEAARELQTLRRRAARSGSYLIADLSGLAGGCGRKRVALMRPRQRRVPGRRRGACRRAHRSGAGRHRAPRVALLRSRCRP
jgi:hypothetical protein